MREIAGRPAERAAESFDREAEGLGPVVSGLG